MHIFPTMQHRWPLLWVDYLMNIKSGMRAALYLIPRFLFIIHTFKVKRLHSYIGLQNINLIRWIFKAEGREFEQWQNGRQLMFCVNEFLSSYKREMLNPEMWTKENIETRNATISYETKGMEVRFSIGLFFRKSLFLFVCFVLDFLSAYSQWIICTLLGAGDLKVFIFKTNRTSLDHLQTFFYF